MRRLWIYFIYLFLVWGSFRYYIKLPAAIEELWFKPILWLVPLFWWNLSFKKRINVFANTWVETTAWGLGVAIIYWLIFSHLRIPKVTWEVIGVAAATAVVEELTFSGFIMGLLERLNRNSIWNLILTGAMAGVLRLPISTFVYKLPLVSVIGVVMLTMATTMIQAWIRQRTGNVAGSMIARLGLNLAILG